MTENNGFKYSNDQVAEIYAKLEVAKMLTQLGAEMAKQAEMDIRFFRMTNDIPEDFEFGE